MTTTFAAIRSQVIASLEGATPAAGLTNYPFRYVPERSFSLREWAESASDQVFRKFDIVRVGDSTERDPAVFSDEVGREEQMLITIAYPRLPSFYGDDGLLDMEDVIRRDARQVRDLLWSGSVIGAVSGWSGTKATSIAEPERDGDVWFQTVTATLLYCESATYT